jgi:hypothetical protein
MREYLSSEIAILVSLVLHALAFLTWAQSDRLARFVLFRPLVNLLSAPAWTPPLRNEPAVPTITFVEEPRHDDRRTFTETDASQFTGEEPKNAQLYSSLPTVAANPENPTGKVGDTPYLEGKETRALSTENVAPTPGLPAIAPVPQPRPPAPPPPQVLDKPIESDKKVADEGLKVVEEKKLVMAEKPPEPAPPPAPAAGSHREIAAIKSRMTAVGAWRIGVAAFNVEGSPFGEYDKALIRAVQSRWYALIEQNGLYERAGTVTLHFNLMADGSVKNMELKENTAGQILELFCEKAVVDSAPFAPLPENLQVLIGSDPRDVNFTFYY